MRNTAALMLIAAIFIGGLTVWLARDFLESRPAQTIQSETGEVLEATTVVVAARPLAFGDTLTRELMKEVAWPADNVPEGSFETITEILDGSERRVALRAMEPNELLLKSRVSGFGGRATLSQVITEGMRAVTIRVNDVNGVAGFVLPGDRVDVMLTRQKGKMGGNRDSMITDVIIQSVRVLAVDQLSSESSADPMVAKAATVEVTPQQGQKLSLAASVGTLTLALRHIVNDDNEPLSLRTMRVSDLTPGLAPEKKKATVRRSSGVSSSASVKVTRGMSSNTQKVTKEKKPPSPAYDPNAAYNPSATSSANPSATSSATSTPGSTPGTMTQEEMDKALSTDARDADGAPVTIVKTGE